MTFKKGFVAAIKSKNKILREKDGVVYLPFGSEYSILLKNLENRKVLVKIKIDGEDVIKGGLVIKPEQAVDLERYVRDNLFEGHKFKFIQKTQEIIEHRGERIDDGIIRIEFAFEKIRHPVDIISVCHRFATYINKQDQGITVPGSVSNQEFTLVQSFETDDPQIIIFQLRGYINTDNPVTQPITVETKLECPTCGKKNTSSANYCSECGTCLIKIN